MPLRISVVSLLVSDLILSKKLGGFYFSTDPFDFCQLAKFQDRNINMDSRYVGIDRVELR
jgi:hypothetical protein